jgi:site-specific DNA recombinase
MKYFLYARKSTDDEERQILSIDAQLDELREFAAREGLTIAREYVEAQTAKSLGRPIFNQLLEAVENGEADGLIAWHPDRLARNTVDGGRVIYLLDCGKLSALKFPTFWFENTPQGKFMLTIAFGQSKYYVDNLSENVRRGLRQKIRRGEFPGKPPIGYLNDPKSRTIVVDPHKAKLIQRMFKTYATGRYTFDQLHELVSSWKLTTHREKPIARSRLQSLLTNDFYLGLFHFNGETHEGAHEAIISRELYSEVQNVMSRRGRPHKVKSALPYLGLIRCGECGGAITGERQKGHHYYRCTKKLGPCSQRRFIREEKLTAQLQAGIRAVSISHEDGQKMLAQVDRWRGEETGAISASMENERSALRKMDSRLSRLMDLYLDGSIDHEDYAAKKKELIDKKSAIKERIARLEQQGSAWLEPLESFLKEAIKGEDLAKSENPEELRGFFQKSGSNLFLIEPEEENSAAGRRARTTKDRAAVGGWSPGPVAVQPSVSDPSGVSDLPERASSRYADRPLPVLRFDFQNPWRILTDIEKYPDWSG